MHDFIRFLVISGLLLGGLLLPAPPYQAAESRSPITNGGNEDEIDRLLEEFNRALEAELQTGTTQTVEDELGEETTILVGTSADKIDELWEQTIARIHALSARPRHLRAPGIAAIERVEGVTPIYVQQVGSPYNSLAVLEIYVTGEFVYAVDTVTNEIVERRLIDDRDYSVDPSYTPGELEALAREYVESIGAVDIEGLELHLGEKLGETYFFRWEDMSNSLDGGIHPFVQVGLTRSGDFLNYYNTIPLTQTSSPYSTESLGGRLAALVRFPLGGGEGSQFNRPTAAFNQVYANGGSYWQLVSGSVSTQSNAGYCYYAGWCSPKNFYYKNTCYGCSSVKGRWNANSNPTVTPYAYVPSTHATTLMACYKNFYNGGSSTHERCINQSVYYNTWVTIAYSALYNIKKIELSNLSDSSATREIAWDETWLYAP